MRISLRTSGGRGEYELAGSVEGHNSQDVYGKNIYYKITPTLIINSFSQVKIDKAQGKPRIRLENSKVASHAHLLFSGILLLPRPKRALKETPNSTTIIRDNSYSIIGINVDVASISPVILVPTEIYAANTSPIISRVSFAERMASIFRAWEYAEGKDGIFPGLIREHKRLIHENNFSHKELQKIHHAITEYLQVESDPMDLIFKELGDDYSQDFGDIENIAKGDKELDEIDPSDSDDYIIKTTTDQIAKWRKVLSRGTSGRKFSEYVKDAYNYRCCFTGSRYPKSKVIRTPGVDAAHILPWAEHQLNEVVNGLCLSKICHWAFDQGVLKLEWKDDWYFLSIPGIMQEHFQEVGFDSEFFLNITGPIDQKNLPRSSKYWPSPQFISELNSKSLPG